MHINPKSNQLSVYTLLSCLSCLCLLFYLYGSVLLNNIGTDGLCYALISRNLSEGFGSLWVPAYSVTQHTPFYEHPSLGFIFESLFFRLIGDETYTEHVYATIIATCTLCMLFMFWRRLYFNKELHYPPLKYLWIVITCWFSVPYFVYYYIGGGLEMLANIFAFPAIYCQLLSCDNQQTFIKKQLLLWLSALCLFIAFMINGPLTLFPLCFYFLYWFVYKKQPFLHYLLLSIYLCLYLVLIATIFFYLLPGAYDNIINYIDQAVFDALQLNRYDARLVGIQRVKIIIRFFPQFILLIISFFLCLYLHSRKSKKNTSILLERYLFENKELLLTLLLSMCATLPILLSPKQSLHYTLQGGFFLLLSLLSFMVPAISGLIQDKPLSNKIHRKHITLCMVAMSSIIIFYPTVVTSRSNNIYKKLTQTLSPVSQRTYFEDAQSINQIVPNNSILSYSLLKPTTNPEPLGNNLMRFFKIALTHQKGSQYALVSKKDYLKYRAYKKTTAQINQLYGYKRIKLPLMHFYLYKRTSLIAD